MYVHQGWRGAPPLRTLHGDTARPRAGSEGRRRVARPLGGSRGRSGAGATPPSDSSSRGEPRLLRVRYGRSGDEPAAGADGSGRWPQADLAAKMARIGHHRPHAASRTLGLSLAVFDEDDADVGSDGVQGPPRRPGAASPAGWWTAVAGSLPPSGWKNRAERPDPAGVAEEHQLGQQTVRFAGTAPGTTRGAIPSGCSCRQARSVQRGRRSPTRRRCGRGVIPAVIRVPGWNHGPARRNEACGRASPSAQRSPSTRAAFLENEHGPSEPARRGRGAVAGSPVGIWQGQCQASSDNCPSGARAEPASRPQPRAAGSERQRRALTPESTRG